jgi:hypothetical protein
MTYLKKRIKLYLLAIVALLAFIQCGEDCQPSARCQYYAYHGNCPGTAVKYFYNSVSFVCVQYTWGECDGEAPFETLTECEKKCYCK